MSLSWDDKNEIEELLVRYTWWLDSITDHDEIFTIFTDDAVLTSPYAGRFEGREGLEAFMRYRRTHPSWGEGREIQLRHVVANALVEGEGDSAFLRAFLLDWSTAGAWGERKTDFLLSGHYECEAVRVDGRWRLKSRVLVVDTVTGGPLDHSDKHYAEVSGEDISNTADAS